MDVKYYERNEANENPIEDWKKLANESNNINPFYEHWSLLPALEHLELGSKVYVVASYKKKQLIALFPVKLERHRFNIPYISLWRHSQCFLCDPLILEGTNISEVLGLVLRNFNRSILHCQVLSQGVLGPEAESGCVSFRA